MIKKKMLREKVTKLDRQYCSESSKDIFIMAIKKDLFPRYPKRVKEEVKKKKKDLTKMVFLNWDSTKHWDFARDCD